MTARLSDQLVRVSRSVNPLSLQTTQKPLSFIAGAYSDKQLIDMAYAFEQASKVRRAPEDL
jgi:Asp-tRNA(Asn)/Glu-tRNA(Gln) amidotransferase A subunit family amidase